LPKASDGLIYGVLEIGGDILVLLFKPGLDPVDFRVSILQLDL
jgi:hypothetical protein